MRAQVIVLNGGSSAGKSGIARCLQAVLPEAWLALGTDTFVDLLPAGRGGIEFAPDGTVEVGPSSGRWRRPGSRASPRWPGRVPG